MTSAQPAARRAFRGWLIGAGALALALGVLAAPTMTRQGINFHVSSHLLPLYVKGIDFLHRHYLYRATAADATRGLRSDAERVQAVLQWTREHIRRTPAGMPVVDDHIAHIMVRGYGEGDQMADVFAALATYAGVPAFWRPLHDERAGWIILAFARVDGRWIVLDVARGAILSDAQGRWLDVNELAADPARLRAPSRRPDYARFLSQLTPFQVQHPLRARLQMPGPRLVRMVGQVLGLESRP